MADNFVAYFLRFTPNACLIQVALKTKQAQYVLQNWPVYSLHCDVTDVHMALENKVLPTPLRRRYFLSCIMVQAGRSNQFIKLSLKLNYMKLLFSYPPNRTRVYT